MTEEPPLANTMKFAKRVHKNRMTYIKHRKLRDRQGRTQKVTTREKKEGYIPLREFIRKNEKLFVNPQGKLADILTA